MSTLLSRRGAVSVVVLTAVWCGLWKEASVANIAAGLGLGAVTVVLTGDRSAIRHVRFRSLLRFLGVVGIDLIKSTISVGYEILTPTDYTDETMIRIDTPDVTDTHRVAITLAITLTPGTAVVDVDDDCVLVHLLHRDRIEPTVEHAHHLLDLAKAAFPAPTDPAPTADPSSGGVT